MSHPFHKQRMTLRSTRRSSALVITLFFVCLMTIIVVGFLTSMRLETFSARSHFNGVVADLYAQEATDAAVARIYYATSDTNRFWVTQPGRLYVSPPLTNLPVTTLVDLSSGEEPNNASPPTNEAVNLNPATLQDPSLYLVASTNATMPAAPMYAKWIYQHQDGTLDPTVPTGAPTANPVVGRYAFWVDDESAKINLNTAWTGDSTKNTNGLAHPSRINLNAFPPLVPSDIDAIQSYRGTTHYYDSVEGARLVNANVAALLGTNNFSTTVYNHAPEINMFGEPRILLTTQKSLADTAGTTNFLDILNTENTDPGPFTNLSTKGVQTVAQEIVAELNRTNWPIMPGQSFATKYGSSTSTVQMALNIIDYVRCAESTNDIVEPLRGTATATSFTLAEGAGTMLSMSRRPVITEYGLWFSVPVKNVGNALYNFNWKVFVKITLPPYYGLKSIDLSNVFLNGHFANEFNPAPAFPAGAIIASECSSGTTILQAGQTVTITRAGARYISLPAPGTLPPSVTLQMILDLNAAAPQDKHTLYVADLLGAGVKISTAGAGAVTNSVAVNDPSVGSADADWPATTKHTFNQPNIYGPQCTTNTATSVSPPQDTSDGAGRSITDLGMHMPAPKATSPVDPTAQPTNPQGMVYSVGELGYIHTGVDVVNSQTASHGVPWRTIRLQPDTTSAGSTTLPDWALLDLFFTPITPAVSDTPFIYPGNSTNSFVNVGGKVNLNNAIFPFVNGSGVPLLSRNQPLEALLLGASPDGTSSFSLSQADTVINNIGNRTLASGEAALPGINTNFLYTAGQVAQFKGVSDSGEASEALVREIAARGAIRGNVFSVYSIGQALKQDKSGAIHVLAARRTQKVFERVMSPGKVVLLPVSSRELQP